MLLTHVTTAYSTSSMTSCADVPTHATLSRIFFCITTFLISLSIADWLSAVSKPRVVELLEQLQLSWLEPYVPKLYHSMKTLLWTKVGTSIPLEYAHFPDMFFIILHTSLALIQIHSDCRIKISLCCISLNINCKRGCIQKSPDWVDNEINNNNKHSLRSNTKAYGSKIY
jgi:hypothetical protein